MMTTTLRIALILVSLGTFAMIMRKIRQSRMQIESAIFWIVLALVLVVYSVFPKVADACASLLGIYATTNFLFLFAIFVLILKVFFMSIHISQLESKIKELVQAMALEEKKYEEEKRSLGLIAGILCLAAAAAWHSLDVRAGIHETGASWQMGQY